MLWQKNLRFNGGEGGMAILCKAAAVKTKKRINRSFLPLEFHFAWLVCPIAEVDFGPHQGAQGENLSWRRNEKFFLLFFSYMKMPLQRNTLVT